jgi:putative restriction endonuclease
MRVAGMCKIDGAVNRVMLRNKFLTFLHDDNISGSGKASSYVRALDLLSEMLAASPMGFEDCVDIWQVTSIERLDKLYLLVLEQSRSVSTSPWNLPGLPPSYLRDGYCSAALKALEEFLIDLQHSSRLLKAYQEPTENEASVAAKLSKLTSFSDELIEKFAAQEGRERKQEVKTRLNQRVFRLMILDVYKNSCCISGLNIPQINRASHILSWAESKETRMDPRNGLCLSATYDAAFDAHLISLDEDYRLLISREISDHFTSEIVKAYFQNRAGQEISVPDRFRPSKEFLAKHRSRGKFA